MKRSTKPETLQNESHVEEEIARIRAKVRKLLDAKDHLALSACKLYYAILCDDEALHRDASAQRGQTLKIIFGGREIDG